MNVRGKTAESLDEDKAKTNGQVVRDYLLDNVAEFRELSEVRRKGWDNPYGDEYFKKQREIADNPDEKASVFFHSLMLKIGKEVQRCTNSFAIKRPAGGFAQEPMILDMCMAPGGFLEVALETNPASQAVAFSLPINKGGHEVRLGEALMERVRVRFLDITMLAADMGDARVPGEHPEAGLFLPRQLRAGQLFDLVLCDGQVLRTQARAPYREPREARRLTSTQLALGLEHLRPGGTMVVLLHRAEAWDTVCLLRRFRQFARVRLFKPWSGHAKRSSFYMVATGVQSRRAEAVAAVARWKSVWRAATFGSDQEYHDVLHDTQVGVEELLAEFGPELVRMARPVWKIQAEALAKSSFMKGQVWRFT